MRIAMLSPIAWSTPPRHYGPWEYVVSLLTEELVKRGIDVTLFATADSQTSAELGSVCPQGYNQDLSLDPKVCEALHISHLFEQGDRFDLIHNHFDFLPLTYSFMTQTPVVTTIHGFSSPAILPVYKKYNKSTSYVAVSNSNKHPELDYAAVIHHGIQLDDFQFQQDPGEYLLFFGRIHREKGTRECIEIAKHTGRDLVIAGIIQDKDYFAEQIEPYIDNRSIRFIGSVGGKDRSRVLGGAYALLHPIQFDEPFGLSVVEAMACGTPVLAIHRGSMGEVIDHGRTGLLADSYVQLARMVEKIVLINRRTCRSWVEEHFTVQRMADEYICVYEELVR